MLIAEETLVIQLKHKDHQSKAFEVLVNTYKERLYLHYSPSVRQLKGIP